MGDRIRRSIIAGSWYPDRAEALHNLLDQLLAQTSGEQNQGRGLLALFVPHARYIYSGAVAAEAYRLLPESNFARVVLIGPSHYRYLGPWATTDFTHYATPLGLVPIDQDYMQKLQERFPMPSIREEQEHSLEIQLPFLQRTLQEFSIVPILSGQTSLESAQKLAGAIAETIDDGHTLVVASSDLSHYHDSVTAEAMDRRLLSRMETLDTEGLAQDLEAGECEACGGGAILATMLFARIRGAGSVQIRKYAHSGDVIGDHFQVVGYAAAAVYLPETAQQ